MNYKILPWIIEDFTFNKFSIKYNEIVGKLSFANFAGREASFMYDRSTVRYIDFALINNNAEIIKNNESIGRICFKIFGCKKLIVNKEEYKIKSGFSFFGQVFKIINKDNQTLASIIQPTFKDIGRGQIKMDDSVTGEMEMIVFSSLLFLSYANFKKQSIYLIIFLSILSVTFSHFIQLFLNHA